MDDLQTYTYDTGLFSIDIPAAWSVEDKSTAGEVLVRWTDSAQNGVILVNLFQETQQQTEDELTALLQNYLENTYQNQPNFSLEDPQPQSDGSVLIVWSYDVELSNGATTKLLGNTFIEQRDDKISLLTTAVPDEQFDALEGSIDAILNSYTIDTSVVIGSAGPTDTPDTQTVVIGDLQTYTFDTGLFSIDIPDNWTIQDNSKPGEAIVLWTDPTENGLIVVDLFEKKQQQTEDELVDFLKNFLQKSFASQSDFSMDDPRPQSDGSILIVWSYTAEASGGIKTKLLGNSFIEQRDDKVSILTTAVPDEQFEALKHSTDTIINSYTIDPSAALP